MNTLKLILPICFLLLLSFRSTIAIGTDSIHKQVNEKINSLESHYKNARSYLEGEVKESRFVDRQKWESYIRKSGIKFSREELYHLKSFQQKIIDDAAKLAKKNSVIKLDKIRSKGLSDKFCQLAPKGGALHLHPSGMAHEKPIREVLEKVNPLISKSILEKSINPKLAELYPNELNFLKGVPKTKFNSLNPNIKNKVIELFFLPSGNHKFRRFAVAFSFLELLKSQDLDEKAIIYENFTRLAKSQGIMYQELSKSMKTDEATLSRYNKLAKTIEDKTDVKTRFIISYGRWKSYQHAMKKTKQLLKNKIPSNIVGVNLVGHEEGTPLLEAGQGIYPLLNQSEKKLFLTVHAGEEGDPRNLRDALIMGVDRIGHGVKFQNDPVHLEIARRQAMPIETSVLSNQKVRVILDITKHPFLRFQRLGLPVSISTDDEGIFKTDINQECSAIVSQTDIQWSELKAIFYNSIESAFLSKQEKSALHKNLGIQMKQFETIAKDF